MKGLKELDLVIKKKRAIGKQSSREAVKQKGKK